MAKLEQLIAEADANIVRLTKDVTVAKKSENTWRSSINKQKCNVMHPVWQAGQKKRCQLDNEERAGKADAYKTKAANSQKQLDAARKEKAQLLVLLDEENKAKAQATVTLAEQGQSLEGLNIIAEGTAESLKLAAQFEAENKMKTAEVEGKNKMILYVSIGAAVLVAVGIFAWFKFKK